MTLSKIFGCILLDFCHPLAPKWHPNGSQKTLLGPICLHTFGFVFRTSTFGCILVAIWLPFGYLLAPFGSVLAPFWSLWFAFRLRFTPLGRVFSHLSANFSHWLIFGRPLAHFWLPLAFLWVLLARSI